METFKTTAISKLEELRNILNQGTQYGFDFSELTEKIKSVKESLGNDRIRIVLLSSFSEGKTSTIAGLLGKIEDNMKIDNDESSDEIIVYRSEDLAEGFEFVDTPGLFGTKEKEIEGKSVRFSEITEKYLSEAHLILFICDAVNPLKESHAFVIEQLMRQYHKLDSTIFVINKMDQASIDLSDDNDFARGAEIKKSTLVQRLKDTIGLTPEEETKLHIVCISADPDGEGVDKWLKSPDEYKQYSHIEDLKDKVNTIISSSDKRLLQIETVNASLADITSSVSTKIRSSAQSIAKSLAKVKEASDNMNLDLDLLRKDLTQNRRDMTNRFKEFKKQVIANIDGASIETINSVLEDEIGLQDKNITFYIFNREIKQIVDECSNANDVSIKTTVPNINKQVSVQEQVLEKAVKGASETLKNVNISGETVKSIRNVFAKNFKFKPWGAINCGAKATKAINYAGKGVGVALEVFKWAKDYRDQKRLKDTQESLKKEINEKMAEIFKAFDNDTVYYKNFAPSFLDLQTKIQKRNNDLLRLQKQAIDLKEYGHILTKWAVENAQDAVIIDEQ